MAKAALAAAAVVAACWLAVPSARADGDPASDFLLSTSVFVPFSGGPPKATTDELKRLVGEAKAGGYTVRVALIAHPYDLGSVGVLWKKPEPYARFLGQELSGTGVYRDRVLTVMPNGYGISDNGQPLPAEQRVLDALPTPAARREDVGVAALTAVQRLAARQGVRLRVTVPRAVSGSGGSSTTSDRLKILAGALTLLGLVAAVEIGRRVRRSRREPAAPSARRGSRR